MTEESIRRIIKTEGAFIAINADKNYSTIEVVVEKNTKEKGLESTSFLISDEAVLKHITSTLDDAAKIAKLKTLQL